MVHYVDIWRAMNPEDYSIVLTDDFGANSNASKKNIVLNYLKKSSVAECEIIQLQDLLKSGRLFEFAITSHAISSVDNIGEVKKKFNRGVRMLNRALGYLNIKSRISELGTAIYLPQLVGKKQIRYMYGADIGDGWSLQSWNHIYDVFLCHGINDEREVKKRFKGKTYIMGYPRYDRYFSGEMNLEGIICELGITNSKKTLLWMPTLGGEYSSIPRFAGPLSVLKEKYNIIVRPHPFSFVREKEFIELLEKYEYQIDRNSVRDMNELFGVADVVLVDNGGSPFSAIFLGKNVIFLDVPDDLGDRSTATSYIKDTSVTELKKRLPVVGNQDAQALEEMLESEEFLAENRERVENLFKEYFDSPRGGGAKRVVDILSGL